MLGAAEPAQCATGIQQLRIYEMFEGNKAAFHDRFRDHAQRIMKRQWSAFMADEEWSKIKREWAAVHGQAVGEIQDRTLKRTDYSPC